MPASHIQDYNRARAVEYARKWAYSRNPAYYDFEPLGGDCTNFISQCVYAGGSIMNYTPVFGWYYISSYNRAPAWTGVQQFYRFLTTNQAEGPFATVSDAEHMLIGDIVQLAFTDNIFEHSLLVVENGADGIYISTHTFNAFYRPLSSYTYNNIRYLHIQGVRG